MLTHWRNAAAAAWFLLAASTESALPPFSDVACVPAVHSGSGATRQSPLPDGTPVSRSTPIQPPVTRLAIVPLDRPVYHWLLHEEIGATLVSTATTLFGPQGHYQVTAEIMGEVAGPKINIIHYKNKTGYRRRMGHRQRYTQVKITGISAERKAAARKKS